MHGCVKIGLHQPLWGSVPTHTKSFCKLATTSTAAPEQWDVMLRGWGAVHGEDIWHRVRCRTGAKRPTQPPKSMQPQREWARATHSCPYAARAQCRAAGKCPIPTPVQRHWLACDSSLRLPLNWGEDFQEVWAAAALAGVCYVIQQQQQPRCGWRRLCGGCSQQSAGRLQHGCSVHNNQTHESKCDQCLVSLKTKGYLGAVSAVSISRDLGQDKDLSFLMGVLEGHTPSAEMNKC